MTARTPALGRSADGDGQATRILRAAAAAAAFASGLVVAAGGALAAQAFPFSFVTGAKATAATAPADNGIRFRILNGDVAADGAWPWQVALLRRSDDTVLNNQYCGGSLVTSTWVMTAAHCVYDEDAGGRLVQVLPEAIEILTGTNLLIAGQGERVPVAHIYAHPDYDPVAIENDIALIELAHPSSVATVRPVQLPSRTIEPVIAAAGAAAVVVGWGRLETGEYPLDLRQVDISILDTGECNRTVLETRTGDARENFDEVRDYLGVPNAQAEQAWRILIDAAAKPITDNMVCSGTRDVAKGSCNGDSGGPLMVRLADGNYVQVGVVSWSFSADAEPTCDVTATFSAYTRVANYTDWIREIILAPPQQPMVPVAGAAQPAQGVVPAAAPPR